jgi:ligand-binding sensor domain-containing protein
MAMAEFQGQLWLGTFDEGLCRYDGQRFVAVRTPFRMVNDVVVAGERLYVATTVGLFRTRDGLRFDKVALFDTRGVNDLAVDGDTLWATSTATLWRIPVGRRGLPKGFWTPGGTSSLQAVDAKDGQVWLATEDRGLLRMRGKTFEVFDRAAGLPSSWVLDVVVDGEGGAFGATLRDGLVHVDKDGQLAKGVALPDPWLLHVSQGSQGVWVGTQGGAARVMAGKMSSLPALPNPCVHGLLEVGADLWVATEQGLARYALADL